MWSIHFLLPSLLILLSPLVRAADTLETWAQHLESPAIQQKILSLIYPGQVGPESVASQSGLRLFPKGGFWVRLGGDSVWSDEKTPGYVPFLVVSVLSYQKPDKDPVSAVSYVLYGTQQKPTALSGGYAAHERVQFVQLPKLKKNFVLLTGSSKLQSGYAAQWTATLFIIGPTGLSDRPRPVWTSPASTRVFQFGFDDLEGKAESLVMRIKKAGGRDTEYRAYRWTGERFEQDSFASESRLKNLPEKVWAFGSFY